MVVMMYKSFNRSHHKVIILIYPLGLRGALLLLPLLPKPPLLPPVFCVGALDGENVLAGLSTVVEGVPDVLPARGNTARRIRLLNPLLLSRLGVVEGVRVEFALL